MTNLKINVTQTDIDSGTKGECSLCPIALAVRREFPDKFPMVSLVNLYLDSEEDTLDGQKISLPEEATAFIQAFDHGERVKPFSFTIVV